MCPSYEPFRGSDQKKKERLKEALEKMARAEAIARGLGIDVHEITRLREEGLRELNCQMPAQPWSSFPLASPLSQRLKNR
jgi:hypothetical protein